MVGLQYLKYAFDHSDESVVAAWVENPYWQYFCGEVFFAYAPPIDPSSMTHWRGYLKEAGVEEMLAETIRTGLRGGFIKPSDLERVNVDTTVAALRRKRTFVFRRTRGCWTVRGSGW
jgi:IS5 family transposase